jgi:CRP-like cAMP-binding protein
MDIDRKLIERLRTVPWFQEISLEHFEAIAQFSRVIDLNKDEILFREGDKEDYIYVVLKGRVAIEVNSPDRGRLRIFTAEALDVVGWSAATPVVRQRTATTRAVVDLVMSRIAGVVAGRLMAARMQLLDFYGKQDCEE